MDFSAMTIKEIKNFFSNETELNDKVLENLALDTREGVQKLYHQYCSHQAKKAEELLRIERMLSYEREACSKGFQVIAGVDEAGRGPLAGPVVAAAVILPEKVTVEGIDDSKKLSPQKREKLYDWITKEAIGWSVGSSTVEEIDEINILQASLLAMKRAMDGLSAQVDFVLVDAVTIPNLGIGQLPIIKGDSLSLSIAAASIIAKVTRDRLTEEYDQQYPEYGFKNHKGYGTQEHITALRKYGPCPLHRRTFLGSILG